MTAISALGCLSERSQGMKLNSKQPLLLISTTVTISEAHQEQRGITLARADGKCVEKANQRQ